MQQTIRIVAVLFLLVTLSALAASFVFVSHSERLYIASVANCQDLDNALRSLSDPQFEGVKFWEGPLARLYRLKYWHHGGPTMVPDRTGGELSVFSVFVTASHGTGGKCDKAIVSLLNRYVDGSRSLDDYDSLGYTALHAAVIMQRAELVRALVSGGADGSLVSRSNNQQNENKSAVELATWFRDKKADEVSARIAKILLE